MRLIANIDVKNEFVIKGIQLEGLRKIGSPIDIIKKFYNQKVHEIIIHDVVASYYKRNNLGNLLKECFKDIFIPVTIGGGIRTLSDIKNLLNYGADKVMINSKAIIKPMAAALPIALFIEKPKNFKIGTFITAPPIPIGAEMKPLTIPAIILAGKLILTSKYSSFSLRNSK